MAVRSDVDSAPEFREGEIFQSEPTPTQRAQFLDHVRETGAPESFPGLCTIPVSGDEAYSIVAPFEIERARRPNLDEIPCAICSPRKGKFLDGRLVYYPHDKRLRIIGHECANAHLDEVARAEYETKRRREADDDFLLENFFKIPLMLKAVEKLQNVAVEYQKIYRAFSAQAPTVHKQLRKVARDNEGLLTIDLTPEESEDDDQDNEQIGPTGFKSSRGGAIGHTETVGSLSGLTALLPDYVPADEFNAVYGLIESYAYDDEAAALDALAKMNEIEKALCVGHLRAAESLFLSAEHRLRDFSDFFTQSNFEALGKWGNHPRNNVRLHAEVEGNTYTVSGPKKSEFKVQFHKRPPEKSGWPDIREPLP